MTILIIIFSSFILATGIAVLINTEIVFRFTRNNSENVELQILAGAVRLVLGALLIFQADASKYPIVIEIIGWISIAAALLFAVFGRQKIHSVYGLDIKFCKPFYPRWWFVRYGLRRFSKSCLCLTY